MTYLAAAERERLCDTALAVGGDVPTLCGDWSVRELVAHLIVRESSPAALGIALPRLSGLADRETRRLAARGLPALVSRLREGPPWYSPMGVEKLDRILNTLEFFVHHEDIRRAQEGWEPRPLSPREQDTLWRAKRGAGRGLVRKAPVGVVIERSDTGERTELTSGEQTVVVSGMPSEVALFLFGRRQHARVELVGDDDALAALGAAALGY